MNKFIRYLWKIRYLTCENYKGYSKSSQLENFDKYLIFKNNLCTLHEHMTKFRGLSKYPFFIDALVLYEILPF
jgi:hypothetical protein